MTSPAWRAVAIATMVAIALVVRSPAAAIGQELTRSEAESMGRKLDAIVERGNATATAKPTAKTTVKAVSTSFTEREVNAFFKYMGPTFMPTGIQNTMLGIGAGGNVTGQAVVDLNAIRTAQPRGWLDPLAYVAGSMEVRVAGRLLASNGKGVFQFQSASVGGVPVSKSVLQELVSFYTKTPEQPNGVNLDEPFDLPSNIRSVQTKVGAATVVQ